METKIRVTSKAQNNQHSEDSVNNVMTKKVRILREIEKGPKSTVQA